MDSHARRGHVWTPMLGEDMSQKKSRNWVSEGKFYIGRFVLLKFIEPVTYMNSMFIAY